MKKLCLAIDATDLYLGLGLTRFDLKKGPLETVASKSLKRPLRQSEDLFPELEKLLKAKKISMGQISLVAANAGPGSFTGVRVGVASARGIAQALGVPAVGVNALEAIAFQAEEKEGRFVAAVIPALKGEGYFSLFDASQRDQLPRPKIKPEWASVGLIREQIDSKMKTKDVILASLDNKKAQEKIPLPGLRWAKKDGPIRPDVVARLGIFRFLSRKKKIDYDDLRPFYLQPSWAEREKIKKGQ